MSRWTLAAAALAAWLGGQTSGGVAFAQQDTSKAKAPAKPAATLPIDDPDGDDQDTPKALPKPKADNPTPGPDAKGKDKAAAAKKADAKSKSTTTAKATTNAKKADPKAKTDSKPTTAAKSKTPAKKPDPKAKSRQMEQAKKTVAKRRAAAKARAEAEHRRQAEERDQQIKILELELKLAQERGAEQAEMARIQADIVRQRTMLQLAQLEMAKINAIFGLGQGPAAPLTDGSQFAVAGMLQMATTQDAFGAVNTTAKVQAQDGTAYTLDFTGRDDLRAQAMRLNEREVLVAGTVRVVRVVGAPPSKVLVVASVGDLATEQRRLAGGMGGQGFGQGAVGSPVPNGQGQVPFPGAGGVGEVPVDPNFP